MAGKGGGAWKVAYADFVTAMMAFFMVMWLVGQDQEKKKAVSEYFKDPWAKSRLSSSLSRNPTLKKTKAGQTDTKKKFDGSNPREVPHDDPESPDFEQPKLVTIRAPERTTSGTIVTFDTGSTALDAESKKRLSLIAPRFIGLPYKIDIRGHVTQAMAATGQADEMWDLSYKRSLIVMNFLKEQGIEEDRMRLSVAGPHEPLVLDNKVAGQDKNSRVEVFLLSETMQQFRGSPKQREEQLISAPQATPLKQPPQAQSKSTKPANKNIH